MRKSVMSRLMKFLAIGAVVMFVNGCSNANDPEPVNEEELITTVNLTFTNTQNASDVVIASFQDLDGPGGSDGTTTNPTLSANASYTVEVEFLNESGTPVEDITEEVAEESDDHQVFMVTSGGLNLTYAYNDQDGNGLPVGLLGTATTGTASIGSLNVILIHLPVKTASGVQEGDITNADGDEDINVVFTVTIQ